MSDDGNAAVFVGTLLESGQSVTLCQVCLPQFMVTMLEGITGVPVGAVIDQMTQAAADEATTLEPETALDVVTHPADDDDDDDELIPGMVNGDADIDTDTDDDMDTDATAEGDTPAALS